MAKGKKKKGAEAAAEQEERVPSIFETLGIEEKGSGSDGSDGSGKAKAKGSDKGDAPSVEGLTARLDALERENAQLRSSTNAALAAGTARTPAAAPPEFQSPALDLSGLPDPEVDREAYNAALSKRISEHSVAVAKAAQEHQAAVDRSARSQDKSGSYDALWDQFAEDHPKYAKHRKLAEVAANSVLERAKARGLDVDRYMLVTSDMFFSDLVKQMEKDFGNVLKADSNEGEDEDEDGKGSDSDEAKGEATRTGGMFGGAESGGKPQKGTKDGPEGDLVDDLTKLQINDGLL